MKKIQNIIPFLLLIVSLLAAGTALYGEFKVVSYSPAIVWMDYNDKKVMVVGDIYYLGYKADSIIPVSSSLLFVNLAKKKSITYNSQMLRYTIAPRSVFEVRSLDALRNLRFSDYDYVLFHSFKIADAFTFSGLYSDLLHTLYSNRVGSGVYALYALRERGID